MENHEILIEPEIKEKQGVTNKGSPLKKEENAVYLVQIRSYVSGKLYSACLNHVPHIFIFNGPFLIYQETKDGALTVVNSKNGNSVDLIVPDFNFDSLKKEYASSLQNDSEDREPEMNSMMANSMMSDGENKNENKNS